MPVHVVITLRMHGSIRQVYSLGACGSIFSELCTAEEASFSVLVCWFVLLRLESHDWLDKQQGSEQNSPDMT